MNVQKLRYEIGDLFIDLAFESDHMMRRRTKMSDEELVKRTENYLEFVQKKMGEILKILQQIKTDTVKKE